MQIVNNLEELEAVLRIDLSAYVTEIPVTHAGIRLGCSMDKVAQAIRQGDRSAVIVCYQIIIHDLHLPFGKIIKSNFARVLKRHIDCLSLLVYLGMPEPPKRSVQG